MKLQPLQWIWIPLGDILFNTSTIASSESTLAAIVCNLIQNPGPGEMMLDAVSQRIAKGSFGGDVFGSVGMGLMLFLILVLLALGCGSIPEARSWIGFA